MPKRNRAREGRKADRNYLQATRVLVVAELKQYARTMSNGNLMYCKGSRLEAQQRKTWGKKPIRSKIIFNSVEDAEKWAEILFKRTGVKRRAYLCPRSKHGHAHLTTKV